MVVFPLRFLGGTLYAARDRAEYVEGKILQVISIARGELPSAPDFGIPYLLFNSRPNFQQDLARINQILSVEVPEAKTEVIGELLEGGIALIKISWSYEGASGELTNTVEF